MSIGRFPGTVLSWPMPSVGASAVLSVSCGALRQSGAVGYRSGGNGGRTHCPTVDPILAQGAGTIGCANCAMCACECGGEVPRSTRGVANAFFVSRTHGAIGATVAASRGLGAASHGAIGAIELITMHRATSRGFFGVPRRPPERADIPRVAAAPPPLLVTKSVL